MINKKFTEEAKETRFNFVKAVKESIWNSRLRQESESLLIMYDQMVEFISNSEKKI